MGRISPAGRVIRTPVEAAAHASAFYRPEGLAPERALDALVDLVLRALVPARDDPDAMGHG